MILVKNMGNFILVASSHRKVTDYSIHQVGTKLISEWQMSGMVERQRANEKCTWGRRIKTASKSWQAKKESVALGSNAAYPSIRSIFDHSSPSWNRFVSVALQWVLERILYWHRFWRLANLSYTYSYKHTLSIQIEHIFYSRDTDTVSKNTRGVEYVDFTSNNVKFMLHTG